MTIDDIKKLDVDNIESFSVFARDKLPMPGKKKRIDEILEKVISVVDFRIMKSSKRENTECLQIQFVLDKEVYVVFTGSVVLIDQIQSVKDKLPFNAKIVKIDKYYSFS
ncbi:MAG: hypothetical protein IK122_03400 [Alphaproteobacteria bacterium]|nr:hypothetical protein [Alphaproteobacteria bacterium]MBR5904514.1 hypothetical protein [Alphaproteobacteria bacterium]